MRIGPQRCNIYLSNVYHPPLMANDKEICNSQKVLSRQYTNFVEDCNKSIWIKDKMC